MTRESEGHPRLGECPSAELIGAHAERRLVGPEAARMDEHVASCPRCHEAFADALRLALDLEADVVAWAPPRAAGAPGIQVPPGAKPSFARPVVRLAAGLAAAAVLVLAYRSWRGGSSSPPPEARVAEAPKATPSPHLPRLQLIEEGTRPWRARAGLAERRRPAAAPWAPPSAPTAVDPTSTAPEERRPDARHAEVSPEAGTPPSAEPVRPPPSAGGEKVAEAPFRPEERDVVRRVEEFTVESASRVDMKLIDAPATMSVITSEALATTPARNMADVLRSVPGLNVIQNNARDFNITARQATSTLATSTLVAVDGRSVYLDFFGFVLWDFVPSVASGDIHQIEVVRGPASVVWGANAVNGVVNFITKTPRAGQGFGFVLGAGLFGRAGGSREADGSGHQFDGGFSFGDVLNNTWSYKLSGGYYHSAPLSRPVGTVPRDCHPLGLTPCRDANLNPLPGGIPIGGGAYPADAAVPGGFENDGTSQPKGYVRVDQDFANGGRMTYEGGFGGTQGIVHTGIGPFGLESGSYMGFGRVAYRKDALRIGAFANVLDAEAPNLLVTDPNTLGPIILGFATQTYDIEIGNTNVLGGNHILTYGASYRRNNFDITLAEGPDRNELGAYAHWEYFVNRFRFALGGRVDKFGNLDDPVFSPRVSVMYKPTPEHSIRASYNKAFVSPSFINNYLNQDIQYPTPVDLTPLATVVPPIAPLIPPPFLLTLNAFGNPDLREQSTKSYELAYTGTLGGSTTIGLAAYLSDSDDNINFTYLFPPGTPGYPSPTYYSVTNPAKGVTLPTATTPAQPITLSPLLMGILAQVPPQLGGPILLPEKAATYLNLGPFRNQGIEASLDHRFNDTWSAFANYSWQDTPQILDAGAGRIPYPVGEVGIPSKHRFNFGLDFKGRTFFANANLNYASRALWVDELSAEYAGFTDGYAMLNAAAGVKLSDGRLMLSLRGTNVTNETIQQHIFGDVLRRSLVLEVRLFGR